jgi:mannosylglycerate hydrolase
VDREWRYPINGECLIRNLNKGLRLQAEFGCSSKVAYHAFGWGQTAQFPQFYKQLGFDLIIAAKKVSEQRAPQSEFVWAAEYQWERRAVRIKVSGGMP